MTPDARKDGPEQRQQPRAKHAPEFSFKVELRNVFTGLIKDISSGGVFIETPLLFHVGDEVHLRFKFPGITDVVDVDGKVRWVVDEHSSHAKTRGVGVQFLNLQPGIRTQINAIIKNEDVILYED